MAKAGISVKNGAVVLPTGYNMDSQSMRIRESQATENVTIYGGTTYGAMRGNGTPIQQVSITGFPFKGNGSGTSNVGFSIMGAAGNDIGTAATITIDTGCTIAGNYIVNDIDMDHSRIVAAAKTTVQMMNAGDLTVTWAT